MMDRATIRAMSADAAAEAAEEGRLPHTIIDADDVRRAVMLGDHRPEGWTLLRVLFVDKSGWGQRGEAALSFDELTETVVPGRAYGIVDEGQFQMHLGEFVLTDEIPEEPVDMSGRATFSPAGW